MKCLFTGYSANDLNISNREVEITLKVPMPLDPRCDAEVRAILKKLDKMVGTMVKIKPSK